MLSCIICKVCSRYCEADGADDAESKGCQEVDLGADQPQKGAFLNYSRPLYYHKSKPLALFMNETNCIIRLAVLFIYGFLTQFIPYFMPGRDDRTLDYAVKNAIRLKRNKRWKVVRNC